MNTETNLPDGLNLAIQYCNIGTTQERRNFAADAIRTEHAQRVTLQHHACDLAQRIAELEAERDTTAAHVASIARQLGGEALQVDDIAVRVLAVVAERDALRARLAQIEARPVPAIPDGWLLVPEEVTPEMEDAGKRWGGCPLNTYLDMIAAAPEVAR